MLSAPIVIVSGPSGVGKSTVSRLLAARFEESVHVRIDDFTRFVVNGWIEPWLPEADHQNRVLGGAVVAAATEFVAGGYAVVIDGNVFPDSLDQLARAFRHRDVPLHYAILRCSLETCRERATHRDPGVHPDPVRFAELHARFDDLGEHERHVVDGAGSPEEVTAAVLEAFQAGALAANTNDAP